jgi:Synergist-CTERM protein sorting domain-containing protein
MALILTLGVAGMASAATEIAAVDFNDASNVAAHADAKALTDSGGQLPNGGILVIGGGKLNGAGWATLKEAIADWSELPGNALFQLHLLDQDEIPAGQFKDVDVISTITLDNSNNTTLTLSGTWSIPAPDINISKINAGAFEGMTGLTNFTLRPANATITELPDNMFNGAKKLSTVIIQPANITTIGAGAFSGTDITQFPILVTNTTRLVTIGAGAFENCPKLDNVNLSNANKLTTIGDNAFSGDVKLNNFIFPTPIATPPSSTTYFTNQLVTIGDGAFKGCKKLLEGSTPVPLSGYSAAYGTATAIAMNLRNFRKLETIGASAFEGCEEIELIDFDNVESLKTVGDAAFKGMKKLADLFNAFDDAVLTSFGSNVFYGTQVVNGPISNGMVTTERNVIDIKFADGVTRIGANAFWQARPLVLFRYDTDKPALTTPKALSDFLNSVDMVGAFAGANVDGNTISIADSAFKENGRTLRGLGLVLENRVENTDTRIVVGALYRAGFTPAGIAYAFDTAGGGAGSLINPTYPLTIEVVEKIVKGIIEGDGDYDYEDIAGSPGTPGGGGDTPGGTPGGGDDEDDLPAGGSSGCDVTGFAPLAALLALGLAKVRKYRG